MMVWNRLHQFPLALHRLLLHFTIAKGANEMGKTLKCMMFGLVMAVFASSVALSQTADNFFGKWELNVQKSTYDPGPAPRSRTVTFEDRGDGVILVTMEAIDAQGNRGFNQFAAKADGKDYPQLVLGAEVPQSISLELVDAYTLVSGTMTRTISEDGKTLTVTNKGKDEQGQQYTNVEVFERQ